MLSISVGLLAGCAGAPADEQFRNQPPRAARRDMALVYFYRGSSSLGCALLIHADELLQAGRPVQSVSQGVTGEEHEIGALNNGSYFSTYIWPGKHTLYGAAVGHDETAYLGVDLEAGKTYYFKGIFYHATPSGEPGAVIFVSVESAQATHEMAELPKADPDAGIMGDCL
jgi:hypothetical protein